MEFILYLVMCSIIYLLIFMPYIMLVALSCVIIWIITTKSIKSYVLKILIVITILLCIFIVLSNFKHEKPSDLYIKMNEIHSNQSLIGLSKKQVVELLGEPRYENNEENKTTYNYSAGNIGKGLFFGKKAIFFDCYYDYILRVYFNESGIVESTLIQCVP